jgi:hypothetical protein
VNRIVHRFLCWLPIWLAIIFCSVQLLSAQNKETASRPKPDSQYIGSTVCKACHTSVWLNKNPISKALHQVNCRHPSYPAFLVYQSVTRYSR